MKVSAIELREVALTLVSPFRISSGVETDRRILLLRLRGDGAECWSECVAGSAPNYFPETIDTAWTILRDHIAPLILGVEVESAREVHRLLFKTVRGNQMAKAAIEMGCWGLEAVQRGVPLAALLGGTRPSVATGISIGLQETPEDLVRAAEVAVSEGYRKIKLKIEPGRDIEYVSAVRDTLPEAPLMVDANSAYTLTDADHLAELDRFGLIMIEQPLAWDDLVDHAQLKRRVRTPICLDESIWSARHARDMLSFGSGDIINIKPGRVGGYTEALEIHNLAEHARIPVWCGGMLETGVGRAYNVAMASLPNFTLPGDLSPSKRYWQRDIVRPEWTMTNGLVTVPDKPGIGVSVDTAYIESITDRRELVT